VALGSKVSANGIIFTLNFAMQPSCVAHIVVLPEANGCGAFSRYYLVLCYRTRYRNAHAVVLSFAKAGD